MTSSVNLLKAKKDESFIISSEGLQKMVSSQKDSNYPSKNYTWTDDFTVELPIKRASEGIGSLYPTTIID